MEFFTLRNSGLAKTWPTELFATALSRDMLPSSSFNSLFWSGPETIINACGPMQNPGQTQIFYIPGQAHLIRTKCDSVSPDGLDDPDNLTQFQMY